MCLAATSFAIAGENWIWWVILALLIIRIIVLGDKQTFLLCLLSCFIFAVRFSQWERNYQEDVKTCQVNSAQHFLIYADKIVVDGNIMKCDALWIEKREKLKLTAFLKNE